MKRRATLWHFAELEKSRTHPHLPPNRLIAVECGGAGMSAKQMVVLEQYTKFPLPSNLGVDIADASAGMAGSS